MQKILNCKYYNYITFRDYFSKNTILSQNNPDNQYPIIYETNENKHLSSFRIIKQAKDMKS